MCSALDGSDEYMAAMDVPRRALATPRRQLPIKSMIEADGSEFRWQNDVSVTLLVGTASNSPKVSQFVAGEDPIGRICRKRLKLRQKLLKK